MLLPLLGCLPPALGLTTLAQQPQTVTEVLAIKHLVGPPQRVAPPPWDTLLTMPHEPVGLLATTQPDDSLSPDLVLELLGQLSATALEQNLLHLAAIDDTVFATGAATEVGRVREYLRMIAGVIARPLQIEVGLWDATDRETPPAVLTAADYARFAGSRPRLWHSVAVTRHAQAVDLEQLRRTQYVRRIEGEVAQKATLSHPVLDAFGEGGHALVRAHALVGGDEYAVHAQLAIGQRRGIVRTLQTGMVGAAELELPTLESTFVACSGRIGNGGALAATLRGVPHGGGQVVVTIRVVCGAPPPPAAQAGIAVLPCSALIDPSLLDRTRPRAGSWDPASDTETLPGFGRLETDQLVEFLQAGLGEDPAALGTLRAAGGFVLAVGPAEALVRLELLLRGLQDRLVRNATVTHQAALQPADAGGAPPGPVLHELVLPTLLGREITARRCLETSIVAGLGVNIAQEATALQPEVRTLQFGCLLRARVVPADAGAHLDLSTQSDHGPLPQARGVMPGGGVLMPAEVARTTARHYGVVANGQTIVHGDGPAVTLDGRAFRSIAATIVRW